MYNPPESGTDSLEYIEFYNNTGAELNLENYYTTGVELTFGPQIVAAGEYLVIAKNRSAFDLVFQAPTIVWQDGALNNSGELISLYSPDSMLVDAVMYSQDSPWPENGDGLGYSIELCDLTADNSDPNNWGFSTFDTGMTINNRQVFGSPSKENQPDCSIIGVEYMDLAINEIMYNPIGGSDSLQYIEIFNYGSDTVSMAGWSLEGDINGNLLPLSILPNSFLLMAKNGGAIGNVFGVPSLNWESDQALGTEMGSVRLISNLGTVIDEVNYSNMAPWPAAAEGTAITLCNIQGDHNAGDSWTASTSTVSNTSINGSPGKINKCGGFSIGEITEIDADGVILKLGETVTTTGTVYGINMRPSGLQFTIIDDNNDGVGVFLFDDNLGYTVNQSDNITITGEVDQFNGLAQIVPTSIVVNTTGNLLFPPTEVTQLSEDTESQLIKLNNMSVVDPTQWTGEGSGFNVDISDGTETVTMRVDADVQLIFGQNYPTGVFSVTGIGGQFDNSSPFDEGYQVLPRFFEDIDPYVPFVDGNADYPARTIAEVTTVDPITGIVDSLDVVCSITGTVYGVNLSSFDLAFTVIDDENNGISVFENGAFTYEVLEGDIVTLQGTIGQFNGLTQMNPDEIILESQGNDLIEPSEVTLLTEDTESSLITIKNVSLVDPLDWFGDGSSFNVEFTDGTNVHTVRIDNDTYWADQPAPTGNVYDIIGIGGQFDNSDPYTEGYQIFPRYESDIKLFDPNFDPYPVRTIPEVTSLSATGVADSIGVNCTLTGIVYGVNLSTNDLIMTIIDENNEGIGVFEGDNASGYQVTEGDMVTIQGTIGQFNGLTQINPVSITLESQGNDLVQPPLVTALDETTESSLIRIGLVELVDPSQWAGDGSSFNLDVVDDMGNQYVVRIDNDTELANTTVPDAGASYAFTGIGGQFDSSDPFDSGYQLLPRYLADVMVVLSTFDKELDNKINISPNPTADFLNIDTEASIDGYKVFNALGQMVKKGNFENRIDVSDLQEGNYSILFQAGERLSNKKFIKVK